MGKHWVLDTETKGTGAEMVPLDKAHRGSAADARSVLVVGTPKPPPDRAPAPRGPRTFKVVDVLSRRVLAEGAGTRATVNLLEGVRSIVDVSIYVWEQNAGAWQQLTQREKQMIWQLRGR